MAHPVGVAFDETEPEFDFFEGGYAWLTELTPLSCWRTVTSGYSIGHEYLDCSTQLCVIWPFLLPCLLRRPSRGGYRRPFIPDPRQVEVLPCRTSIAQN